MSEGYGASENSVFSDDGYGSYGGYESGDDAVFGDDYGVPADDYGVFGDDYAVDQDIYAVNETSSEPEDTE